MADLNFPNSPVDGQEHEGYIYDAVNGVWIYIAPSVAANNETLRLTAAFDQANAAYDKANSANLLAFNSAAGANAYASSVGDAANTLSLTRVSAANLWTNTVFGYSNTKFLANSTGTFEGNLTVKDSLNTSSNIVSFGTAFKIDANGEVFIFGTLNML